MYLRHYGLRSKPFQFAHDPTFYYAAAHQVPLNELCYSLEERQGLATIVGEPGTGKTTLLRRLLQSFGPHQRGIFMSDTSLEGVTLLRKVAQALGVARAVGNEKALPEFLWKLLLREAQVGKTVVLLIDEAQGMSRSQLEEVRYLTNLENDGRKLMEIILAGQPDLEKTLAGPAVAALQQRVAVRCHLEPLDVEHTRGYIEHRLSVAGASNPRIFTPDAIPLVHEKSGGVPRLINIISERCLLVGFVEESPVIDPKMVEEAISDLKLTGDAQPEPSPGAVTESPAPSGAEARLLMRMGARMESVEEKIDLLFQMLIRAGFIKPELAEQPRTQRWLEDLLSTGKDLPRKLSDEGENHPAGPSQHAQPADPDLNDLNDDPLQTREIPINPVKKFPGTGQPGQ